MHPGRGTGQKPWIYTIQLIYGEPLVVPEESVIASRVWEFTSLDYEVQTETPFIYDSLLDPSWKPLHLRGLLGTQSSNV